MGAVERILRVREEKRRELDIEAEFEEIRRDVDRVWAERKLHLEYMSDRDLTGSASDRLIYYLVKKGVVRKFR